MEVRREEYGVVIASKEISDSIWMEIPEQLRDQRTIPPFDEPGK